MAMMQWASGLTQKFPQPDFCRADDTPVVSWSSSRRRIRSRSWRGRRPRLRRSCPTCPGVCDSVRCVFEICISVNINQYYRSKLLGFGWHQCFGWHQSKLLCFAWYQSVVIKFERIEREKKNKANHHTWCTCSACTYRQLFDTPTTAGWLLDNLPPTNGWVDEWVNEQMHGWVSRQVDGWKPTWMKWHP